jgi:hypothetical protein
MLGILLFLASFIVLFSITLIIPSIPPGNLLVDLFKNVQTSNMIAGISVDHILIATINGIVWGVIILIIYSYCRGPQKDKKTLPVWVPGYTTSRSSKE